VSRPKVPASPREFSRHGDARRAANQNDDIVHRDRVENGSLSPRRLLSLSLVPFHQHAARIAENQLLENRIATGTGYNGRFLASFGSTCGESLQFTKALCARGEPDFRRNSQLGYRTDHLTKTRCCITDVGPINCRCDRAEIRCTFIRVSVTLILDSARKSDQ
jgi:hypothetical protein